MNLPELLKYVRRLGRAPTGRSTHLDRPATITPGIRQLSSGPPSFIFPYMGQTLMPSPPPPIEKPEPKPVIPVKGMKGYSERGEPDGWDTAMGEVYGYRWWTLSIPAALAGLGADFGAPCNSRLTGANSHRWYSHRMEAKCTAFNARSFLFNSPEAASRFIHRPPEIREACGCGFWAYFDRDLPVGTVFGHVAGRFPSVDCLDMASVAIPIFGVIKGTGRVIIGDKGFRCQYAQIMGLCVPDIAVDQLGYWNRSGLSGVSYEGPVSADEQHLRVAAVETLLTEMYPTVKLFSSQDLLTRYFPPDKNYA